MQETKKTFIIHYPTSAGKDIFNKEDYIVKVVSENDEESEIILEIKLKDN